MTRKYRLVSGNLHFIKYTNTTKKNNWETEIKRYDWRWERQSSRYRMRCPFRFVNYSQNNEHDTKLDVSYECVSDNSPLPEEKVMYDLMISKMNDAIADLSNLEQYIIYAYYFNCKTDFQISKSIGKSRQTITRLRHEILEKLRNLINNPK